jgi:hypothetical protein
MVESGGCNLLRLAAPSIMGAISAELEDRIEILSRTSLHMPVSGKMDLGMEFGPLMLRHTDVSFQTLNIPASIFSLYSVRGLSFSNGDPSTRLSAGGDKSKTAD